MAEMGEDLKRGFVQFLESLPEDKRNIVIRKLRQMEPAEREEAIKTLAEGYLNKEGSQAAPARPAETAPVNAAPVRPVQPDPISYGGPETAPAPDAFGDEPYVSPAPVRTERRSAEGEETVKSSHTSNHKLNPSVRNALIGAAAAVVVFGVVLFGIKGGFKGLAGGNDDPADPSAVTEVSDGSADASEAVPSDSETTATETTVPTDSPTPTPTPGPTPVPLAEDAPDLAGLIIVIDPGHQQETDEERETVASWMSADKPRCTSGCEGVATGVHEYEITLNYSLFLKNYLEQCGATVYLTRTENDVNISNQERAFVAVANDADVFIRLHADAANDSLTSGVKVYVPDSGDYTSSLSGWGNALGNAVAEAEGLEFRGCSATYNYTGLNYANTIPSFQIVLGYLSNSDDEALLLQEDNQFQVASAIADFLTTFTE